MKCKNNYDTIILSKQLSFNPHSCLLPIQLGECIYSTTVIEGKMCLKHSSFNPDGGTWFCPPSNNQRQYYDIVAVESKLIELIIGKHFNDLDKVEVVNYSLTKPLCFTYNITYLCEFKKL